MARRAGDHVAIGVAIAQIQHIFPRYSIAIGIKNVVA